MRYILYIFFVVLYFLQEYFSFINPDTAFGFHTYYVIAFVAVSIDFFLRIKKSHYFFFPVILSFLLMADFWKWIPANYSFTPVMIDSLAYAFLGILLLSKGRKMRKKGHLRSGTLVSIMGVLCMQFILRLPLIWFPQSLIFIKWYFQSFIPYFVLLLAASAQFGIRTIRDKHHEEKELFNYLILLNIIPLIEFTFHTFRSID